MTSTSTSDKITFDNETMWVHLHHDFNESLEPYHQTMRKAKILIFDDSMGYSIFDHEIILVPNIEILTLGYWYNQIIVLTHSIVELSFGSKYNQPTVLSPRVRKLTFGKDFNQPIVLVKHIVYLKFDMIFDQPIVLTPCLRTIIFGTQFKKRIFLSKRVSVLRFGLYFNQSIVLSKNIKHLVLGYCFNQPILLTPCLEFVTFGEQYGQYNHVHIQTKMKIKHLSVYCPNYRIIDNLPNNISCLTVNKIYEIHLYNVPDDVGKITRCYSYTY